ncbi:MAG TPA: tryptophan 7-halogenase [Thermoanaerobaculia bacterium]|jgi:flavin-dependent dehydrogenase|nr:tryptophan 7-halogenase [Thermoanaerobaculia bacterium]
MSTRREDAGEFDIVICGGGLAGLCLARQLSMNHREWTVLLIDRLSRPLPEAEFKVGESTIEVGAYYLSHTLGLHEHLEQDQLEKLGLRYFYGGGHGPLSERGEFGVAKFLPAKSYQISRGRLENHLRQLVVEAGVCVEEGCSVSDIEIRPEAEHREICYRRADGVEKSVQARWVIDAMGRRRYLQGKFDLRKDDHGVFNAAWFRVTGEVDIDEMVPPSETRWHGRVTDRRWHSTNHLMGPGYWVWLIPLAGDRTSVGIVASGKLHSLADYNTYDKALAWLEEHEPDVVKHLTGREVLDFKILPNYSYSSKQVFSTDRWACVGDAGVFVDPYYSVGTNMIGYNNRLLQKILELDFQQHDTREFVAFANQYFLSLTQTLAHSIHSAYPFFDNGPVMVLKTAWDYFVGWGVSDPQFYYETYLDPKVSAVISTLLSATVVTQARMLRLFEDWARLPTASLEVEFVDYFVDLPTLRALFLRNLPPLQTKDLGLVVKSIRDGAERIEELAQVVFFFAVECVLPGQAHLFSERPWLNVAAISLNSESWEADGLFQPKTKPRDLRGLEEEIRSLFRRQRGGRR